MSPASSTTPLTARAFPLTSGKLFDQWRLSVLQPSVPLGDISENRVERAPPARRKNFCRPFYLSIWAPVTGLLSKVTGCRDTMLLGLPSNVSQ